MLYHSKKSVRWITLHSASSMSYIESFITQFSPFAQRIYASYLFMEDVFFYITQYAWGKTELNG